MSDEAKVFSLIIKTALVLAVSIIIADTVIKIYTPKPTICTKEKIK